jgi:hypothetical protein
MAQNLRSTYKIPCEKLEVMQLEQVQRSLRRVKNHAKLSQVPGKNVIEN